MSFLLGVLNKLWSLGLDSSGVEEGQCWAFAQVQDIEASLLLVLETLQPYTLPKLPLTLNPKPLNP